MSCVRMYQQLGSCEGRIQGTAWVPRTLAIHMQQAAQAFKTSHDGRFECHGQPLMAALPAGTASPSPKLCTGLFKAARAAVYYSKAVRPAGFQEWSNISWANSANLCLGGSVHQCKGQMQLHWPSTSTEFLHSLQPCLCRND